MKMKIKIDENIKVQIKRFTVKIKVSFAINQSEL